MHAATHQLGIVLALALGTLPALRADADLPIAEPPPASAQRLCDVGLQASPLRTAGVLQASAQRRERTQPAGWTHASWQDRGRDRAGDQGGDRAGDNGRGHGSVADGGGSTTGNRWSSSTGGWSIELGQRWQVVTTPQELAELRAALQGWPSGQRLLDLYAHEVGQQLSVLLWPQGTDPALFVAVTTLPVSVPTEEHLRDPQFMEPRREALRQRLAAIEGVATVRFEEPRIVHVDQTPSLWLGGALVDAEEQTLGLWDTRFVPGKGTYRVDAFAAPRASSAWVEQVNGLLATFDGAQDVAVETHWLSIALPLGAVVLVALIVLIVARSYRNSRPMRHLPPIQEPGDAVPGREEPPGAHPRR